MSIKATCPQCRHPGLAKDEWAGRRVKCPKCGAAYDVPVISKHSSLPAGFRPFAPSEIDVILREGYPYILWCAIRDARTPEKHRSLEECGINRTPVYRRDDPFLVPWFALRKRWAKKGRAPCRCGWIDISAETAATSYGIVEPIGRMTWIVPPDFDPWESKLVGRCRNG